MKIHRTQGAFLQLCFLNFKGKTEAYTSTLSSVYSLTPSFVLTYIMTLYPS